MIANPYGWELAFSSTYEAAVYERGVPALFTANARGELRLDVVRTNDAWGRLHPREPERRPGHCLLRDRATGWVQYVLVSSVDLVAEHPRMDLVVFETQAEALAVLRSLGDLPVVRGEFPPPAPQQG